MWSFAQVLDIGFTKDGIGLGCDQHVNVSSMSQNVYVADIIVLD